MRIALFAGLILAFAAAPSVTQDPPVPGGPGPAPTPQQPAPPPAPAPKPVGLDTLIPPPLEPWSDPIGGAPGDFATCPAPAKQVYGFPAAKSSPTGPAYWVVSGDHGGNAARDIVMTRWDAPSKSWTSRKPGGSGTANSNALAYGTPLRSMADGEVIACWANAPNNPGIGLGLAERDGCDGKCDLGKTCSCTIPRSGNFVVVKTAAGESLLIAHLQSGSIPKSVCPKTGVYVKNANAKPVKEKLFYEDVYLEAGQRPKIKRGDLVGLLGNSGASSGPHVHIQRKASPDCPVQPMFFDNLALQSVPANGGVAKKWTALNTVLPTGPSRLMLVTK